MRHLAGVALLAASMMTSTPTHASPASHFVGDPCEFKAQLWAVNQDTASRMGTFDADMRAAYGSANPYTGSSSSMAGTPVPLSGRAVAEMRQLHGLITSPPAGLIPRTWNIARQYGMSSPFSGRAEVPEHALRLVFKTEFAFDNAVVAETKSAGGGLSQYHVARKRLIRSWTALKAVRCVPAAVSSLKATVQNGWVTFDWHLSSQMGVTGFAVYAGNHLLFQVTPSPTSTYLYATPYLPGPYVLRMFLSGGRSRTFTFPLTT